MLLVINAIAHGLVDAACAAAVFGYGLGSADFSLMVLLYNTLAFSTQCVVGLITDRFQSQKQMAAISCVVVAAGALLPGLTLLFRVILVGLGNSLFHVAGGTVTLEDAGEKSWPLGVFVAPGALGLTLGSLYPRAKYIFGFALLLAAAALLLVRRKAGGRQPAPLKEHSVSMAVPLVLLAAVAVRAIGGTAVNFPWKSGAALSLLMTGFVFLGKTLGGFVCDKLGAKKTALLSIPLAAVCIAFCSQWMLPSLAGQLLLNLTMPVTLVLIYRAMPEAPGFAFGLAASALWPGTIAGQLLTLTGPALWICVLGCFLVGLAAILWASGKIERRNCAC